MDTTVALVLASVLLCAAAVVRIILRWRREPGRYASIPATLHDRPAMIVGTAVSTSFLVWSAIDGSIPMAVVPAALFGFTVASIVHAVRRQSKQVTSREHS